MFPLWTFGFWQSRERYVSQDELDVSKVVADDADAAFKIVQHLIHGGARRIALLTGPEQLSIGKNRMKGYLKAMTLNKLEINTDYIVRCEDFGEPEHSKATSAPQPPVSSRTRSTRS